MNYKWLLYFNGHFGERDKEITVLGVSKAWEHTDLMDIY